MPITQGNRLDAARRALMGPSAAEKQADTNKNTGTNYGDWKFHPEKGWIREATNGPTTIYETWSGPYGSSPMNPNGPSEKNIIDPSSDASSGTHNPGVLGGILKTALSPVSTVLQTVSANKKALTR